MLGPVIWNEVTGNVLGGHQRLACLDLLEGHGNYLLDVSVVQLDKKTEVEQNVFLNNPEAQGEWDLDALSDLFKSTPGLELDNIGFDYADIQMMFDDPDLSSLFAPNAETNDLVAEVEKQQDDAREADAGKRAAEKAAAQLRREGIVKEGGAKRDTEVFAVVLFKNREGREAFMRAVGLDPEERYADGARVMDLLKGAATAG